MRQKIKQNKTNKPKTNIEKISNIYKPFKKKNLEIVVIFVVFLIRVFNFKLISFHLH